MSQTYEAWFPVEDIPKGFISASVAHEYDRNVTVRLHQGYRDEELTELIGPDLVLEFGPTPALMVHEEFSHPWNDLPVPLPKGREGNRTHPCLIVRDSLWLASFTEQRLIGWEGCVHYLFITAFPTIDVLSNSEPKVSWQAPI